MERGGTARRPAKQLPDTGTGLDARYLVTLAASAIRFFRNV